MIIFIFVLFLTKSEVLIERGIFFAENCTIFVCELEVTTFSGTSNFYGPEHSPSKLTKNCNFKNTNEITSFKKQKIK